MYIDKHLKCHAFEYGIYKIGDYIMDLMKDIYKKELRTRIAAWKARRQTIFSMNRNAPN